MKKLSLKKTIILVAALCVTLGLHSATQKSAPSQPAGSCAASSWSGSRLASLLSSGVLPSGGALLAGIDGNFVQQNKFFGKMGMYISDGSVDAELDWGNSAIKTSDTAGTPWFKSSDDNSVPRLHKDQSNYSYTKEYTYNVYGKDDWDAAFGLDSFSLMAGTCQGNIKLQADINLGEVSFPYRLLDGATLDGNGHTLTFEISSALKTYDGTNSYAALFAEVEEGATIQDLLIDGATVTGGDRYTSVLTYKLSGTIKNCLFRGCALKGKRYMGMAAAKMESTGNISYCMVVGGSITTTYSGSTGFRIGGIVGNIGSGGTCQYNISMLDAFYLDGGKPTKATGAYFGRIYGLGSNTSATITENCGWAETRFGVQHATDVYKMYHPYWSSDVDKYTGYVGFHERHGLNWCVGDRNKDVDGLMTWAYCRGLQTNFWQNFNWNYKPSSSNSYLYPLPPDYPTSDYRASALPARRAYETQDTEFKLDSDDSDPDYEIFTAKGLAFDDYTGTRNVNAGKTVHLYTNIEFSTAGDNAPIWAIEPNFYTSSSSGVYYFGTVKGDFDGHGHHLVNLRPTDVGNSRCGFISHLKGNVSNLGLISPLTDTWSATASEASNWTMSGVLAAKCSGGSVENCLVKGAAKSSGTKTNAVGVLIGYADLVTSVEKCVVASKYLNSAGNNSYVGGIVGRFIANTHTIKKSLFVPESGYDFTAGYIGMITYGDVLITVDNAYFVNDNSGSTNGEVVNVGSTVGSGSLTSSFFSNNLDLGSSLWYTSGGYSYLSLIDKEYDWDAN